MLKIPHSLNSAIQPVVFLFAMKRKAIHQEFVPSCIVFSSTGLVKNLYVPLQPNSFIGFFKNQSD
ncbi:hypothetical protein NBRC111894_2777 [Sporolactobacillus inulinus]|uniref:Uncharacterized protein n=1 Tax=Sporolactobacillus inulinus TaxID=2078 RepID=A0A4Y1ZE24_9BACL|nr:hypothetical protein NBRC111894_2777 [Sporolactobacillus inulinus]